MWCPSSPCNTGLLSSSFLILTLAKASTYLRPIRVRGVEGPIAPQDFDGSVTLISTRDRLCPPHYNFPLPQIFRPSYDSVSDTCLLSALFFIIESLAFFQIKFLQGPDTNPH